MIRLLTKGPRSLTRTSAVLPLSRFLTTSRVCMGKIRCAAVIWYMSYRSPLAVLPWKVGPYQEATPFRRILRPNPGEEIRLPEHGVGLVRPRPCLSAGDFLKGQTALIPGMYLVLHPVRPGT